MGAELSKSEQTVVANVRIFNQIRNNDADLKLLREVFESLGCTVAIESNNTFKHLCGVVKTMIKTDFSGFKYIVIIVLDNSNKHEGLWLTTDNKLFSINSDLLTLLGTNSSLLGKLRLSIIQNNRSFTEEMPQISRRPQNPEQFLSKNVKFYATSVGCCLNHSWSNDTPSPFIKTLCEEIQKNQTEKRPIIKLLHEVKSKVEDLTDDVPSTEINFDDDIFLGSVRIEPQRLEQNDQN